MIDFTLSCHVRVSEWIYPLLSCRVEKISLSYSKRLKEEENFKNKGYSCTNSIFTDTSCRGVYKTQSNIYDGPFSQKKNRWLFSPKSSIIDARLGYKYAFVVLVPLQFLYMICFYHLWKRERVSLQKKWSFPLRISSANVTKSTGNCGGIHPHLLSEVFLMYVERLGIFL